MQAMHFWDQVLAECLPLLQRIMFMKLQRDQRFELVLILAFPLLRPSWTGLVGVFVR